ncbi:MAG TPA: ATP-binding protein [Chitinophagaceae bacterium]|nr:ATP-binding protein [Chitinophagaceae bacterium]
MSYILALTALGMLVHLLKIKKPVRAKRWLIFFYLGLAGWQFENVIRYSTLLDHFGTPLYSIQTVFFYIPCLALTLTAHTQYTYNFLVPCFRREQKVVLQALIILSVLELCLVAWNELYNDSDLVVLLLSCFALGLIVTLWNIVLSIRKFRQLQTVNKNAARAHTNLAIYNGFFVVASALSLFFGFFSTPGFWSYFLFVWFGTLSSIVLYIVTAAIPANITVKVTGFVFILAATILCIITLAFYPPVMLTDLPRRLDQQRGLGHLMIIITIVVAVIFLLMPYMLKISFTNRLTNLLSGVQAVNSGKMDTIVNVGLKDEIGKLTQNFNQMTQSLNRAQRELTVYAQTLERKVVERTAQLEQSFKELKDTQAQLVLREKMASLGELTAGIAHEIQNPLNFVNNFSEINAELFNELKLLLATEQLSPHVKEYIYSLLDNGIDNLRKISHHGQRADAIVKGMMMHSGNHSGEKKPTDINALAEEYLKLSYHGMRAKDPALMAYLQTEFDENLDTIEVVPQEIGRVFLNLFNNSFYSILKKKRLVKGNYEPTVFVSTRKVVQGIEVKVRDNGVGLKQKDLDKIFQPFYTTKPTGEGVGLGLTLTYEIVTKGHGGEMKVQTKEGEYAEFSFLLPGKEYMAKKLVPELENAVTEFCI